MVASNLGILGYPVLITTGSGRSGSGFLLQDNTVTYFCTAKHVIFTEDGNLRSKTALITCRDHDPKITDVAFYDIDFDILQKDGQIFSHISKDVCAFKVWDLVYSEKTKLWSEASPIPGVKEQFETFLNVRCILASDAVKFPADVVPANDVYVAGYPLSLGDRAKPQFDYAKPLLRKGIVSNVDIVKGTIVLDCAVYFGNSGGPVFELEQIDLLIYKFMLIGVVSQYVPFVEKLISSKTGANQINYFNSGYSIATGIDAIYEILKLPPPVFNFRLSDQSV